MGYSPESRAGKYKAALTSHYNYSEHLNIEFEVTRDALIGREINVSSLDDTSRESWEIVVTIPISKHFDVIHPKNEYGQELKHKKEEESTLHDWSRYPFMRLNFSQMKIHKKSYLIFFDNFAISSIEDREWDKPGGFFGFSANVTHPIYGSGVQAKLRFNFLKFEHDKTFKRTPYSDESSKLINSLFVIGEKIDSYKTDLFVAKWDLRKKHIIYLTNFNTYELKKIGRDVIKLWNDQFYKIAKKRPFVARFRDNPKHIFDLRYPSLNLITDKKDCEDSPLGVAMTSVDVRNGNILWGSVNVLVRQFKKLHQ